MTGDMVSIQFDYGDLPVEKVLECETAFQTACAIEDQATRMIGEQFAKVKENLKSLRNGNGWREWCDKKLNISHTQAEHYINEFQNGDFVKNLYKFGKSARFLLTAPTTPQEVRDRADAIADAGGDTSHKAIKQLKADYDSERQSRLIAEQRSKEWNEQYIKERDEKLAAEQKVLTLESQPKPEPEVIEKEVVPADYESAKQQAATLQAQTEALQTQTETLKKELENLQTQQAKLVSDQVKTKLQGYQNEVDEMEQKKAVMQEQVDRMKEYMASLNSESKRLEVHQDVIEKSRLHLISLAAFLSDSDEMNDKDTRDRWLRLSNMHNDAHKAILSYLGLGSSSDQLVV